MTRQLVGVAATLGRSGGAGTGRQATASTAACSVQEVGQW